MSDNSDFFKTYKHIIKTILYSDGIENLSDKDKKKLLNRLRNNPLEPGPAGPVGPVGPAGPVGPPPATAFERIFEEKDAILTGSWKNSANGGSGGESIIAGGSGGSNITASARYTFSNVQGVPYGSYDMFVKSVNSKLGYRSSKVYNYIDSEDALTSIYTDQTDPMTDGKWLYVGSFKLTAANDVVTYSITNKNIDTDRYVSVDAIKIINKIFS
jgi:hypothetical protein